MMYDREKSDLAIVAVKPTNKAGQPAAELVEPRAGAAGNASQQSTGRAQYRGTVSQALKRMRNFVRISRRAVTHPRWEPYARIGLVRICAGGREVTRVPTAKDICSHRGSSSLTRNEIRTRLAFMRDGRDGSGSSRSEDRGPQITLPCRMSLTSSGEQPSHSP
jgi:hypothetical protein